MEDLSSPNTIVDATNIGPMAYMPKLTSMYDQYWNPQELIRAMLFDWVQLVLRKRNYTLTKIKILTTILQFIWSRSKVASIFAYFLPSITIYKDDSLFMMLYEYLEAKGAYSANTARKAVISTKVSLTSTCEYATPGTEEIKYLPSGLPQWMWFERKLLTFTYDPPHSASGGVHPNEITIKLIGRGIALIQRFLEHIRTDFQSKHRSDTLIYRHSHRYDPARDWKLQGARPRRDMESVVLDDTVREGIIADLTWYWDPKTIKAYQGRQQPHRRGYMLFGPPGTGKTSTVAAIAGTFDLGIYVLSLNKSMSDDFLMTLMGKIPPRAIVLIEDIDCVALNRHQGVPSYDYYSDLTLGGVLNAIDGISSPVGHILIFTTNHPEWLDEALIRPGRIDRQFLLDKCSQKQLRQLFIAAFRDPENPEVDAEILECAVDFANKVPERFVSPAKVQMYLSLYDTPTVAVAALDIENDGAWLLKPDPPPTTSDEMSDSPPAPNSENNNSCEDSPELIDKDDDDNPSIPQEDIDTATTNNSSPEVICQKCTNKHDNGLNSQNSNTAQKSWWHFRT